MDPTGTAARFRPRRTSSSSSSDRFLDVFTPSSPSVTAGFGDELSEDDVFWTGDFYADHNHSSNIPSSSASTTAHRIIHPHHRKGIGRVAENSGILAVLPASKSDQSRSVFNHKASVSSSAAASSSSSAAAASSSSSSRMIPTIPKKPPLDRQAKYHQSAPVNVPVMTEAMRRRREMRKFDVINDDDEENGGGDGEMTLLPPHEVVASRQSPLVACSVLEGVGRTLKGRDLRQVRNAVWRKTGFLD